MKEGEVMFQNNLERCPYRYLQQTAKAMGLPSNVKKVYLIKLINVKNYGTPRDLDCLVRHVRTEQKRQAQIRKVGPKKRQLQQSPEISSTSQSPPITNTPRRVGHILIRYTPEGQSPKKYPHMAASRRLPAAKSDRVLRSSNRVTKPSYLLNNTLMSLMKDSDERSETKVKTASTEEITKASRSFANKIIVSWQKDGKVVPLRSANNSPPLGKRPRRLSGVYPLQPEDIKKPCVVVRRADGSFTKINAIFRSQLAQNSFDRQKQFDNLNPSTLKANGTPSVMSKMVQNSSISSNFNEMNSVLNCRSSNLSELSSNFTFRSSNMSELTLSLTSRQSDILNSPNLGLKAHSSESEQNSGHRTSMAETSPTNNYRPTNYFSFNSGSDETTLSNNSRDNYSEPYGEYYHKKIRAEQVMSLRRCREMAKTIENECRLPKINLVFSQFNSVFSGDVMQPLHVQVDSEPEIAPPRERHPFFMNDNEGIPSAKDFFGNFQYHEQNNNNAPNMSNDPDPRMHYQGTNSLETIYNLKMPYQPTRHCSSAFHTHTVYCTPVICTTKTQPSSTDVHNQHNEYNIASPPRESQPFFMNENEGIPSANDFFGNFHYHEQNNNNDAPNSNFRRSCSSVETITSQEQELTANLSIPEMVEDALEIISQDGDYMERMGMDIRMQCILCNWAGPKIILEYHIRKEHSTDIVECESNEFSMSYTLGKLSSRRVWLSHVLQHEGALYVLSAKYEDPDCFMAALSSVSYNPDDPKTGSLTTYNKVTGEPFTWTGEVMDLPPCMPYENDPNCFRLQISKMDLLPNSANLELLNRELVLRSPTKVVVGQPELDSIHISLTVKILN